MSDTIFALSTGSLPSGVAIVRVSGPAVRTVIATFAGVLPPPRQASLRQIRDHRGEVLDTGLVLFFPGPASFTGEDCAEFQLHGSRAVIRAVLEEIGRVAGCRIAEAGEFSRRAFENGKLDLVEIEGLADLLAAETEMQRRKALVQAEGVASRLYDQWRRQLLEARAMVEAELDFADEGDVPGSVSDRVWGDVARLRQSLAKAIADDRRGEIIRDGFQVVILGRPNAGKSSLLNALAGRDVAIVTHYAGTTRDILQCDIDLDGYVVRLYDTAGIRETDEVVELEGIKRARLKSLEADLLLHLVDVTDNTAEVIELPSGADCLRIGTKIDAWDGADPPNFDLLISTQNDSDLLRLKGLIVESIRNRIGRDEGVVPSRMRQVQQLKLALQALDLALDPRLELEIRADGLRQSGDALARLIGRVDTEMILGQIFAEFCIGK